MKAKSRKRLLISSVAMLLVAMLALGTATFAWFSVNKTVTADTLKVTASAPKGLQVTVQNGEASDPITDTLWGNKKSFTGSETSSVTAVSIPFANSSSKNYAPKNYFYPKTVKDASAADKAIYSVNSDTNTNNVANFAGWETCTEYPAVNATKNNYGYGAATHTDSNSNTATTMIAYKVGVRSTDDISSETITGKITFESSEAGYKYTKVAVFEVASDATGITTSNTTATDNTEAKALIADQAETIKAISAASDTAITTTDVAYTAASTATWTFNGLDGAGTSDNTAKYFYILMWVEGQDGDANDTNPSLSGQIKVDFSY